MHRAARTTMLTLAALASLVVAAPLSAQNTPQPAAQQQAPQPDPAPGRFDIDFAGGTVDQYVEAIRRAHPAANIVVLAGAGAYGVPAIRLRNVTVTAALQAVEQRGTLESGAEFWLAVAVNRVQGGAEPVHQLQYAQRTREGGERTTRVWSVADLIVNGAKPADILGAVEVALLLESTPIEIRFHEPTQLVMARGYPRQLHTVEAVLIEVDRSQALIQALTNDAH